MDDINGEDARRGAESATHRFRSAPAGRTTAGVDWVLFAPVALLALYWAVVAAAATSQVTAPRPLEVLGVAAAALALAWACVEVHWRIAATDDRENGDGRWTPSPTQVRLFGWAVVSAVLLVLLDAFPRSLAISTAQARLLFAVFVAAVLLSAVVSGPLYAVVQFSRRHS